MRCILESCQLLLNVISLDVKCYLCSLAACCLRPYPNIAITMHLRPEKRNSWRKAHTTLRYCLLFFVTSLRYCLAELRSSLFPSVHTVYSKLLCWKKWTMQYFFFSWNMQAIVTRMQNKTLQDHSALLNPSIVSRSSFCWVIKTVFCFVVENSWCCQWTRVPEASCAATNCHL